MKFIPKQKFILTIAVSIIVVGLLGWLFWWLSSTVRDSTLGLQEVQLKITSLEEEYKLAHSSASILDERKNDLDRISGFAVDKSNPVVFIEALEDLARRTGNQITLDLDQSQPKEGFLYFRVAIEGREQNVRQYLKLLGLMPYEVQVENLIFQDISSTPGAGVSSTKSTATHRLTILLSVRAK